MQLENEFYIFGSFGCFLIDKQWPYESEILNKYQLQCIFNIFHNTYLIYYSKVRKVKTKVKGNIFVAYKQ